MKINYQEWMICRVFNEEEVVGTNFETGKRDTGTLELSIFNLLIAATLGSLGYVSFAPYKVKPHDGILGQGQKKHKTLYNIRRNKEQVADEITA